MNWRVSIFIEKGTSNSQGLVEDIILINEWSKRIKLFLRVRCIICSYLCYNKHTCPLTESVLLLFLARIDNRVVLPAPEGPMIAKAVPGSQYPLQLLRIWVSLDLALTLSQDKMMPLFFLFAITIEINIRSSDIDIKTSWKIKKLFEISFQYAAFVPYRYVSCFIPSSVHDLSFY